MPPEPHAELESIAQMLSGQLRAGPDGRAMIECGLDISDPLAWAMEARRLLGARVRIYGFWAFENPEATVLEQIRERHDFAVIDKRWIVDLWFQRYHSSDNPPTVVDLENPAEMQRAAGFFGDPQSWERDMDMERRADLSIGREPEPTILEDLRSKEDFTDEEGVDLMDFAICP